jgi:alginate O-acetyltransferase complex protein AlgI
MSFDSIEFAVLLIFTFLIYWLVLGKFKKAQNFFLLCISYIFYGFWNWELLGLIIFSSAVDYCLGLLLHKSESDKKRKIYLGLSLATNLGLLGYFKYANFFIESFVSLLASAGISTDVSTLNIILPVGISFYTFQTLSYTIDIYRRDMNPTKDIISFFTYVAFFPQLVAGPIERAKKLLPQFHQERSFVYDQAMSGLGQILWGLFKKMVIADRLGHFIHLLYSNPSEHSGSTLAIGMVFFAIQVYCDFSAYSDIAIGTAKLLGFELSKNFNFPYFSRSVPEFWQRWHISLSTWCRDYIYIPLGGNRGGKFKHYQNTIITFTIMGLWHGSNFTFIMFGLVNGLVFLPSILSKKKEKSSITVAEGRFFPNMKEVWQMSTTFIVLISTMVWFRASSISNAIEYFSVVLSKTFFQMPSGVPKISLLIVVSFMTFEWIARNTDFSLEIVIKKKPTIFIWSVYILLFLIIYFFQSTSQEFIYFQF